MSETPTSSSCCTSDGSCHSGAGSSAAGTVGTVYAVSGMTCGHCVGTVTKAISGLKGVSEVSVDLAAGRVTVTSDSDLDDALVAAEIEDAGYELTGRV